MRRNLKIIFITLPQRRTPDFFPPYGAMSVVKSLRKIGYRNTSLLNLDVLRLSQDEAVASVTDLKPDIIGISAPVSTSYGNCKYFASEIRKRLSNAIIVLGGNLTASAELIVKKTEVDYCVIGEGEKVACELFKRLGEATSKSNLYDLKGLAFMDNGDFIFTGYADQIAREEIFDVDWDDLDSFSLKHYFRPIKQLKKDSITFKYFFSDSQNIDSGLLNKSVGIMLCSKGGVGRCTYCHRFIGGIRIIL